MPLITQFEDLFAWQKARELRREVSKLTRNCAFRQDPDLRSQLRRAALSAMSNIAEGFERDTGPQFSYFLNIAKSSAAETQSELYAALDDGLISRMEFERVRSLAKSVNKLCGGLMAHIRRRKGPLSA